MLRISFLNLQVLGSFSLQRLQLLLDAGHPLVFLVGLLLDGLYLGIKDPAKGRQWEAKALQRTGQGLSSSKS